MYENIAMYTTWNDQDDTPTQITSGLYDNYEELIESTGKNYFLGVKLNSNNEVTNAYACGVKDNVPFCIEGNLFYAPETVAIYTASKSLLQGTNLYNNTCLSGDNYIECGPWDKSGPLSVLVESYGNVEVGIGINNNCAVYNSGRLECVEYG